MKKHLFVVLLLTLLFLAGCAGGQPALSPAPEPLPTPEPTPVPTPTPTPPSSVVLTDETAEEILALAGNPLLREVDGTASAEAAALADLQRLRPDVDVRFVYDYRGTALPCETTELTVTQTEGAEEALRCLPHLEKVDMRAVDWSVADMERMEETYPEIDFVWTLHFGGWTVTSDITCFSTLRTGDDDNHHFTDEELYPLLRFCRHLRALDLGHNYLTDLTLIGEMRELQVLILADNPLLTDISPLANLTELYYLELFMCSNVEDYSPIFGLKKMMDINLSYDRLESLSFLDDYPELANAWLRSTGITYMEGKKYSMSRPGVTVMAGTSSNPSAVAYGWRRTKRNIAIRQAFTYWENVKDWRRWDDIEYW